MRKINVLRFTETERQRIQNARIIHPVLLITSSNGAGKSRLVKDILGQDTTGILRRVLRATTRQKRGNETNQYLYVPTISRFKDMAKRGEFLDWIEFPSGWYGTVKKDLIEALVCSKIPVIEADIEAALAIIDVLKEGHVPCMDIFVSPVSTAVLETNQGIEQAVAVLRARMLQREGSIKQTILDSRTEEAKERLLLWNSFSFVVVNENGKYQNALAQLIALAMHQ